MLVGFFVKDWCSEQAFVARQLCAWLQRRNVQVTFYFENGTPPSAFLPRNAILPTLRIPKYWFKKLDFIFFADPLPEAIFDTVDISKIPSVALATRDMLRAPKAFVLACKSLLSLNKDVHALCERLGYCNAVPPVPLCCVPRFRKPSLIKRKPLIVFPLWWAAGSHIEGTIMSLLAEVGRFASVQVLLDRTPLARRPVKTLSSLELRGLLTTKTVVTDVEKQQALIDADIMVWPVSADYLCQTTTMAIAAGTPVVSSTGLSYSIQPEKDTVFSVSPFDRVVVFADIPKLISNYTSLLSCIRGLAGFPEILYAERGMSQQLWSSCVERTDNCLEQVYGL